MVAETGAAAEDPEIIVDELTEVPRLRNEIEQKKLEVAKALLSPNCSIRKVSSLVHDLTLMFGELNLARKKRI